MPNQFVLFALLGMPGLVAACSGASSSDSATPGGSAGTSASSAGTVGAGGSTAGAATGGAGVAGVAAGSGGGSGNGAAGIGAGGSVAGGSGGGVGAGVCASPLEAMVGGLCVAKSVPVTGGYSIDATEVTLGQYKAWLATSPALPSASDATCGWNTSYELPAACLDTVPNGDEYPVVCVDWCDARAYCQGVGKRLCGKIGGGSNATTDYANAATSEWYRACSSGGVNAYPYGDTRDASACNGYDYGNGIMELPVGSLSTCQSSVAGYQGVFDLSGNVNEWEDSCSFDVIASGFCLVRGGSVVGMLNCDTNGGETPKTAIDNVGIRCCSP